MPRDFHMRENQTQYQFLFLIIFVLTASGCAAIAVGAGIGQAVTGSHKTLQQTVEVNKKNLKGLTYGISRNFALEIMGTNPFRINFEGAVLEIKNPYKIENLKRKGRSLEVIYYVTDVKEYDRNFTNEELAPLIFENEKLIGWGWAFFNALK